MKLKKLNYKKIANYFDKAYFKVHVERDGEGFLISSPFISISLMITTEEQEKLFRYYTSFPEEWEAASFYYGEIEESHLLQTNFWDKFINGNLHKLYLSDEIEMVERTKWRKFYFYQKPIYFNEGLIDLFGVPLEELEFHVTSSSGPMKISHQGRSLAIIMPRRINVHT